MKRIVTIWVCMCLVFGSVILFEYLPQASAVDLIIGDNETVYIVSGYETWGNVTILTTGKLVVPSGTVLNATNIFLQSNSIVEITDGTVILYNPAYAEDVCFNGSCSYFNLTDGANVSMSGSNGFADTSNPGPYYTYIPVGRGGDARLNITASLGLRIENSSINLRGGDGFDLPASTTIDSNAWITGANLDGYVAAGGNASILFNSTDISLLKIYNSILETTGGDGGNAADGGNATGLDAGEGGGYSDGGNVSGDVGKGGESNIEMIVNGNAVFFNTDLNSFGGEGGRAGDGGGSETGGGGGGGYAGGRGGNGNDTTVGENGFDSGIVDGYVGAGGNSKVLIQSSKSIHIDLCDLHVKGGKGGNAGHANNTNSRGAGGAGGYGGAGGGGASTVINTNGGDGGNADVNGHVGSGGKSDILLSALENILINQSNLYSGGGKGGDAGDGGTSFSNAGSSGGGYTGGGGGANNYGDAGSGSVYGFVGIGGDSYLNINTGINFTLFKSEINLEGGNGGEAGNSGGTLRGTFGVGAGGGGGYGGGGGGANSGNSQSGGSGSVEGDVGKGGDSNFSAIAGNISLTDCTLIISGGIGGDGGDAPEQHPGSGHVSGIGGAGYGGGGGGGLGEGGDGVAIGNVGKGGGAICRILGLDLLKLWNITSFINGGQGGKAGNASNGISTGGGGGGGYGGGGGGGRGYTGGNTIVGDFVGVGGNSSVYLFSEIKILLLDSRFGVNAGDGGVSGKSGDGGDRGSWDQGGGGGGGGYGGGGGGGYSGYGGDTTVSGWVGSGGNSTCYIESYYIWMMNSEFALVSGNGGTGTVGGAAPKGSGGGGGYGGGGGAGSDNSNGGTGTVGPNVGHGGDAIFDIISQRPSISDDSFINLTSGNGGSIDHPGADGYNSNGGYGGGNGGSSGSLGNSMEYTPMSFPLLFSPENNSATNATPMFEWLALHDSTTNGSLQSYTIEIDDDLDFSSPEVTDFITSAEYMPLSPLSGGLYYWRVKAIYSSPLGSTAGWSDILTFSTDNIPPVFAGLLYANDSKLGNSIYLLWNPASDPSMPIKYNIYISTNPGGQNFLIANYTTSNTNFTVPGLINGMKYYFVVRAEDGGGNEETNTVEKNATPTDQIPSSPTLHTPTDYEHITGIYNLTATSDSNTVSVEFFYDDGSWHLIGLGIYNIIDGKWYYNWDTTTLDLVNVTVSANATDGSGFKGNTSCIDIEIDNTAPTPTLLTPIVSEHITGIYNITATSDSDTVSVEFYYYDGIWHSIGTGLYDSVSGKWFYNWDTTALDLVNLAVSVNATDEVIQSGSDSNTGIEIDNTPPSPILLTPGNNEHITGIYNITATCDPDAVSVEFYYNNGSWHLIGAGIYNATSGLWYCNWDTSGLDLIDVMISVNATDDVILLGTDIHSGIEIDNTPPSPTLLTPANNEHITGIYNITATSGSDTVSVEFFYYDGMWHLIGDGIYNINSNTWYYDWDTTGLDLIDVTISANATDEVGLIGSGSNTGIEIDNTAPEPILLSPIDNAHITGIYNITASCDPDTVSMEFYYFDGMWHLIGAGIYDIDSDTWYYDWDTSGLDLINVIATANATDEVGLQGNTVSTDIEIDNTPPSPILLTPANNEHITGIYNITSSSDSDTVSVEFYYYDGMWHLIGAGIYDIDSDTWYYNWDTTGLDLIDVMISANATDEVGLIRSGSNTGIEIDNTAPEPILLSPIDNAHITGIYNITASCDPDTVSMEFYYNDGSWHLIGAGIYDATSGIWYCNWDTSGLDLIDVTISVNATDDVILLGTDIHSGIEIDNTPPSPTLLTPANNEHITGIYNITTTSGSDTVSVEFYYYDGMWHLIGAGFYDINSNTGYYNWDTTGLDLIDVTISANATDEVGLIGSGSNTGIEIDNTAPEPILLSPIDNAHITGIYNITASCDPDTVSMEFYYFDGMWYLIGDGIYNINSNTWYYDWDTSGLDLINVIVTANGTDEVGLQGNTVSADIEIDNTPPSPILLTPANNEHITGIYNITSSSDSDTVSVEFYYYDGSWHLIGAGIYDATSGTWYCNWDTTGLDLIDTSISANATDEVDLIGSGSITGIEIDNTAPEPILLSPIENAHITGIYNITASCDPDTVSVEFYYYDGSWHLIGDGHYDIDSDTWHHNWATTGLDLIDTSISANATDEVDLIGSGSNVGIEIDNTAPEPILLSPIDNAHITGIYNITASCDPDTVSVELYFFDGGWISLSHAYFDNYSGIWYYNWDTTGLDLIDTSISANATDEVSLIGSDSNAGIEIDNTAPVPVLLSPLDNAHITGNYNITASCDPDIVTLKFYYYDGSWHSIGNGSYDPISGNWNLNWNTISLNIVDVTISVNTSDEMGFWGNSTSMGIEIDNTPPSPTLLTPPDNERIGGLYNLISSSDPDTVYIEFFYYDDSWHSVGTGLYDSVSDKWYLNWDTTGLNLIGITVRVNATDEVTLTGSDENMNISIDNTAPSIVSIIPTNNSTNVAVDTAINLEFNEPINTDDFIMEISFNPIIPVITYEWNSNKTVLRIKPSSNFTQNTLYIINMKIDAKDDLGNTMSSNFTWSFTTMLDTDGDGLPDIEDLDDDNDGVPDEKDEYPLNPTKWKDSPEWQDDIILLIIILIASIILIFMTFLILKRKKMSEIEDFETETGKGEEDTTGGQAKIEWGEPTSKPEGQEPSPSPPEPDQRLSPPPPPPPRPPEKPRTK